MNSNIPSLDISVYHLIFLSNSITHSWQSFEKVTSKNSDNARATIAELSIFENIISLILIRTNSLLDEYNHQFNKLKDPRINHYKLLTQPVWDRINKWTEISSFRHNVLAHNLRLQKRENYKSIFFAKSFTDFDIPKTLNEVLVLVECIELIKQQLLISFDLEYQNVLNYLETVPHDTGTKECNVQAELKSIHDKIREAKRF